MAGAINDIKVNYREDPVSAAVVIKQLHRELRTKYSRKPADKLLYIILRASHLSSPEIRVCTNDALHFSRVVATNWDLMHEEPITIAPSRCICSRPLSKAYFIRHKINGNILLLGVKCFKRIQHAIDPYRYQEALHTPTVIPIRRPKKVIRKPLRRKQSIIRRKTRPINNSGVVGTDIPRREIGPTGPSESFDPSTLGGEIGPIGPTGPSGPVGWTEVSVRRFLIDKLPETRRTSWVKSLLEGIYLWFWS